jgi:hypothetical protein
MFMLFGKEKGIIGNFHILWYLQKGCFMVIVQISRKKNNFMLFEMKIRKKPITVFCWWSFDEKVITC